MAAIIRVVGASGAGKTTLIEKLVPVLKAQGLRVGTVKHASHGFAFDREGSDSARHTAAGAEPVALIDGEHTMLLTPDVAHSQESPTPLKAIVARWFAHADVVLAEGFSTDDAPAIVVHRKDLEPRSIGDDAAVLCAVTDTPLGFTNELDFNDESTVNEVADLIANHVKERTDPGVTLLIGGEAVGLSPFVASFISSTVRGMLDALKNIPDDKPEIELRITDRG